MKKCLVISGGDFFAAPRSLYDQADFVIACDKGWEYAKRLSFTPDVVIGDFDSYSGSEGDADIRENGTPTPKSTHKIIKLSRDKDDSDTLAAVKYAIKEGCDDFTFICAMGGRFDHLFCNIQTLSFIADRFGLARLFSEKDEIIVIKDRSITIPKKEGWSLSVFSLCDESRGVTEEGTRWLLNGAIMQQSAPYGLSNEWTADKAEVSVEEGTLIIILSKME
ncbi:thiamine pyrophosphokinase [Treponema sp. JC4]|uniref:thiamine diphosphokinase n=1 Tax=Treponema sp. JC4 TaxID=1124982 RepID=UPI00025B0C97|nr:thiamine diphosphokinase [Treponema sp. JC4]EID84385.1 thiamine pyrophosphokinase [Treponema sp. JC4]